MDKIPYYDKYVTKFRFNFISQAERDIMKNGGYHQPAAYCHICLVAGIWIRNIIVSIGQTEDYVKAFAPWEIYVYFPNAYVATTSGSRNLNIISFDCTDLRNDFIQDIKTEFMQWWKDNFKSNENTFVPNQVSHVATDDMEITKDDIPFEPKVQDSPNITPVEDDGMPVQESPFPDSPLDDPAPIVEEDFTQGLSEYDPVSNDTPPVEEPVVEQQEEPSKPHSIMDDVPDFSAFMNSELDSEY